MIFGTSGFQTGGMLGGAADQNLCCSNKSKNNRTLHPHDHRSRRSGPRSHLWLRHHRLRGRAMGPPLDHLRHLSHSHRPGQAASNDCALMITTSWPILKKALAAASDTRPFPISPSNPSPTTPRSKKACAGRRSMQAIAKYADQETLYDQPFIDKSKVRVTGPFTVEAVPSPVVKPLVEVESSQRAGCLISPIRRDPEAERMARRAFPNGHHHHPGPERSSSPESSPCQAPDSFMPRPRP